MLESLDEYKSWKGDWTSLWETKAKDNSESPWDFISQTLGNYLGKCCYMLTLPFFWYSSLRISFWPCLRWDAWIEGRLSVPMLLPRFYELRNARGLVSSQWLEPSQFCAMSTVQPFYIGGPPPFCWDYPVGHLYAWSTLALLRAWRSLISLCLWRICM